MDELRITIVVRYDFGFKMGWPPAYRESACARKVAQISVGANTVALNPVRDVVAAVPGAVNTQPLAA